jgi:hypothetical protein
MSLTTPKVMDNPDHIKKIEYLELELKKAQEMNIVYQKKWEKLKETAKKKRESKGSNSELMVSTVQNDGEPKSPKSASFRVNSPTMTQSMYFSVQSHVPNRLP